MNKYIFVLMLGIFICGMSTVTIASQHNRLVEKMAARDLAAVRKCYAKGDVYLNPFMDADGSKGKRRTDWLSRWAEPRLALSEAEELEGKALLSDFALKYLPNAYTNYEKKREMLLVLQQLFNEEFPEPWTIKESSPKWNAFNKVLEKFVRARAEYFVCHDELCHYWIMHRFGVLTANDFVNIDQKRLSVKLHREDLYRVEYPFVQINPVDEKMCNFAAKYASESNAYYQKMEREFRQCDELIKEVIAERRKMDCVRVNSFFDAAIEKRNMLAKEINSLSKSVMSWYYDHITMEKTSEDVVKCDKEESMKCKVIIDSLSSYIKESAYAKENSSDFGVFIPESDMIVIPGRMCKIQKTEVTQKQWVAVMGNNPSRFKGDNRPVEQISWNDCQKFIEKLNELEGVNYRLPTGEEWVYVYFCGKDVPNGNGGLHSGRRTQIGSQGTYDVAQKEANEWGVYDMDGNVSEWTSDRMRFAGGVNMDMYNVYGGCWAMPSRRPYKMFGNIFGGHPYHPDEKRSTVGFRLAISQD